ncbi:MAG: hypothetical protein BHV69_03505 [Bacteroidales bacterium 52_46]|nr:MAG: hypothetical protein BHV69_03505 [Bacteroidales bacterium 52_46]
MKQGIKHLQSLIAVALCIIMSTALYSCSDDDDDEPNNNAIVGEWIKRNGDDVDIYYQFSADGKGRYICLSDEPGYDPEYPDAVIKHPVDPFLFDYTLDGNILTMKEYYNQYEPELAIYVNEIEINNNVLQMKRLRYSYDGIDWNESTSDWETYKRYSSK